MQIICCIIVTAGVSVVATHNLLSCKQKKNALALTHVSANKRTNRLMYTRSPNYHSSLVSYHTHTHTHAHTYTRSPGQPADYSAAHTHPAIDTPTRPNTQALTHSLIHFLRLNQQTTPGVYVPQDLHDMSNVVMCIIRFNAGASSLAPSTSKLLTGSYSHQHKGVR